MAKFSASSPIELSGVRRSWLTLATNVERGRLRFSLDLQDGVEHAEVIFLCVGTPPLPDGEADLSAVERVTRQIAMLSDGYRLIVEKSTVQSKP